jgi:hypothetical protein
MRIASSVGTNAATSDSEEQLQMLSADLHYMYISVGVTMSAAETTALSTNLMVLNNLERVFRRAYPIRHGFG